jgi:predicted small lipoprotein YifL
MSSKKWLAVAAWVFVSLAAAQQKQPNYTPADATSPVSAISYESAFKSYRTSTDESPSPDKVWRSANDDMGRLGGHAGHMKASEAQPPASSSADNAETKHRSPADHSKHH